MRMYLHVSLQDLIFHYFPFRALCGADILRAVIPQPLEAYSDFPL
jgi:hypothetical protein